MTEGGILRAGIGGVAGGRTHSTVRLLIGPLLTLVRSLLVLTLRLLILKRPLLVLVLRLLILVRSLLILIPLLILVLSLLILVAALLILVLAWSALLLARARLALTETRTHGWEGTEINSTLSMRGSCGQAEEQDRSGGPRRRTHSFRVPGPVHKSFSRQVARI
jgi:hypothetical protein